MKADDYIALGLLSTIDSQWIQKVRLNFVLEDVEAVAPGLVIEVSVDGYEWVRHSVHICVMPLTRINSSLRKRTISEITLSLPAPYHHIIPSRHHLHSLPPISPLPRLSRSSEPNQHSKKPVHSSVNGGEDVESSAGGCISARRR